MTVSQSKVNGSILASVVLFSQWTLTSHPNVVILSHFKVVMGTRTTVHFNLYDYDHSLWK